MRITQSFFVDPGSIDSRLKLCLRISSAGGSVCDQNDAGRNPGNVPFCSSEEGGSEQPSITLRITRVREKSDTGQKKPVDPNLRHMATNPVDPTHPDREKLPSAQTFPEF